MIVLMDSHHGAYQNLLWAWLVPVGQLSSGWAVLCGPANYNLAVVSVSHLLIAGLARGSTG